MRRNGLVVAWKTQRIMAANNRNITLAQLSNLRPHTNRRRGGGRTVEACVGANTWVSRPTAGRCHFPEYAAGFSPVSLAIDSRWKVDVTMQGYGLASSSNGCIWVGRQCYYGPKMNIQHTVDLAKG
jgi:hypothetical protein